MLETQRRSQSEACVSDLRFDQWHGGELGPEEVAEIERHVEHCDVCRARHSELEAQADAFLARFPNLEPARRNTEPSRCARRSRSWQWRAALATLAAAAAVVLVTRSPDPGLNQRLATRTKGGATRFGFHVKQLGGVHLGIDGQEVHPGDQLRFFVSTASPQHVAILSRDGAGVVSEYYPGKGQSRAIGSAQNLDLDSSVELDATLGREVLWAVFCSEPFSTEPLRRQLQQTSQLMAPVGCTTERLIVVKAQP